MADRMYNGDIYILNVELKEDLRGIKILAVIWEVQEGSRSRRLPGNSSVNLSVLVERWLKVRLWANLQ